MLQAPPLMLVKITRPQGLPLKPPITAHKCPLALSSNRTVTTFTNHHYNMPLNSSWTHLMVMVRPSNGQSGGGWGPLRYFSRGLRLNTFCLIRPVYQSLMKQNFLALRDKNIKGKRWHFYDNLKNLRIKQIRAIIFKHLLSILSENRLKSGSWLIWATFLCEINLMTLYF